MAQYVLGNDVTLVTAAGATRLSAGKVIDDLQYDVATLQAAGAVLVLVSPARSARAALLTTSRESKGQGLSLEEAHLVDAVSPWVDAGGSLSDPWTLVTTAMSPYTANVSDRKFLVDSTAGPVTINTLVLGDQQTILVKDQKGQSAVNPIHVVAPGGYTIDETQAPGTYGAQANITTQGQCAGWQYIASLSVMVEIL